jgi:hypothetical protein
VVVGAVQRPRHGTGVGESSELTKITVYEEGSPPEKLSLISSLQIPASLPSPEMNRSPPVPMLTAEPLPAAADVTVAPANGANKVAEHVKKVELQLKLAGARPLIEKTADPQGIGLPPRLSKPESN